MNVGLHGVANEKRASALCSPKCLSLEKYCGEIKRYSKRPSGCCITLKNVRATALSFLGVRTNSPFEVNSREIGFAGAHLLSCNFISKRIVEAIELQDRDVDYYYEGLKGFGVWFRGKSLSGAASGQGINCDWNMKLGQGLGI